MRLLLSWVRDFVDVTASPADIAERMALRGFEVAAIETLAGGDAVVDFEVTANRPDCLSVIGFAREIATAYQIPMRELAAVMPGGGGVAAPPLADLPLGDSPHLNVSLEDPELCPRYAAAVGSVGSTAVSTPAWMSSRLEAAGVRPISPIVDVTNYVLMELGHPMHAFDLDRLDGAQLRIRRAARAERMTTLDGVERTLDAEMLVIADANRPQAIAGVMGGGHSEVSAGTRRVAFESAYFQPASVRRTSKRLGLKTEASSRFERGTDISAPVVALQRAIALMQHIGAGTLLGPAIDRYPAPRGRRPIHLRRDRVQALLGLAVPDDDVERILRALGIAATPVADGWATEAPTYRVDLLREVDLIEEVGRHFGFDRIDATFPVQTAAAAPPDPRIRRDRLARRVLSAAGLSEAVTFGFVEAEAAQAFVDAGAVTRLVAVANPLSAKFDTLRPSLLPGLVDSVAHNRRHGRRDVALYELGARFSAEGESRGVGFALTGSLAPEHWSAVPREVDFFDAKGILEQLCGALGASCRFEPVESPYLTPGQSAALFVADQRVGVCGRLTATLVERRGAPRGDAIYVAELDLERLPAGASEHDIRVAALPRFPSVVRDLSIVVPETLPAAIIRGTIQAAGAAGAAPLVSIDFFDRYKGKGVAPDAVSLSVRLVFQAPDRTLTDADVQQSVDTILASLVREHGAVQR